MDMILVKIVQRPGSIYAGSNKRAKRTNSLFSITENDSDLLKAQRQICFVASSFILARGTGFDSDSIPPISNCSWLLSSKRNPCFLTCLIYVEMSELTLNVVVQFKHLRAFIPLRLLKYSSPIPRWWYDDAFHPSRSESSTKSRSFVYSWFCRPDNVDVDIDVSWCKKNYAIIRSWIAILCNPGYPVWRESYLFIFNPSQNGTVTFTQE